jgi:hypothetical protein
MLLTVEEGCDRTWAKNRIHAGKSSRVLGATRRKVIKQGELVGERNRREGRNTINTT